LFPGVGDHAETTSMPFMLSTTRDRRAADTDRSLKILATGREALDIGGETVLQVAPLPVPEQDPVPPPEALLGYDAVRLFVERARAAWPPFEITPSNAAQVARPAAPPIPI